MKKIAVFFKDAIKALVGAFAMIGFMEVINVIISSMMGQYVRIDGGIIDNIVENYISYGALGYAIAWMLICYNKIIKDDNKDILQKTKSCIIQAWIIATIMTLISGILTLNLEWIIIGIISYFVMFGFSLLVLYIIDKKSINEINKKIKEKDR